MRLATRIIGLALLAVLAVMVTGKSVTANPSTILFAETGFAVSDTAQARFLTEFNRLGGLETFGYPVSQPFDMQGYSYQVFQRAALQWRPSENRALLVNTMDWLSDAGKDDFLAALSIPRPDRGTVNLAFSETVAERELWLTDEGIADAFHKGGGIDRFGLPTSKPVRSGPFVVQRFQRYVFQRWVENVSGMPGKGTVVGVLVGDYLIQTDMVPKSASTRVEPGISPVVQPVDANSCVSPGRITAIGDSVMLAAASDLEKSLGDIDVDAVVGRQVSTAIDVLESRLSAKNLGRVVVMHIGNNGTFTARQFDEIMKLAGPYRNVVFVNDRVPRSWETANNAVMAEGVGRYTNATLIDWNSASMGRPNLLWDDGVHLRPDGVRAYVGIIVPVVRSK